MICKNSVSLLHHSLRLTRELNQCLVVYAPVMQSIIFPSAVLPVAPMEGLRVVVAFAIEERTSAALHCAVRLRAIRAFCIAELLAVIVKVVVFVPVRVPGVLAPSHARVPARYVSVAVQNKTALGVLPRVLGVPESSRPRLWYSLLG